MNKSSLRRPYPQPEFCSHTRGRASKRVHLRPTDLNDDRRHTCLRRLDRGTEFGKMKLNISYPANGSQKLIEIDDERKLRALMEKRMGSEVSFFDGAGKGTID